MKSVTADELELRGYPGFIILPSGESENRFTFLPPDTAVCADCLSEFFSADDRRFSYPFITCTNCGPRFSIINDIPYDRKNTSMDKFAMCPLCGAEYDNPSDRRFHTQPNACPECGPHVSLCGNDGTKISDKIDDVIAETVKLLSEGKIVAIKGVGGYLLACDGRSDAAVKELRDRKKRPFKPFALMAGSIEIVEQFLEVSQPEKEYLLSKERPIVLLKEKKKLVSRYIAPSVSYHGIMLPYMPFQHLLFGAKRDMVLVMTSGNISDEPIIYKDSDAFKILSKIADYIVTYDRDIVTQSDDSIVFVEDARPFFVRRSRGFVPAPFYSSKADNHILATGGDLKNSFGIAKDDVIIMSQYLGDMESLPGNELYRDIIKHFNIVYDFSPAVVVSDMHPGYFTTIFAEELEADGLKRIKVQHHHAHVASVMEDRGIEGDVIGISFDGTGYGTDGTLWGSEFLIAGRKSFRRAAHFSGFHLPGGESAIKDVWKTGLSLLYNSYGNYFPRLENNPQSEMVLEIMKKGINSPQTCSIGRIFDGISSILGISKSISTEAEAAMLLEETAIKGKDNIKPLEIPYVLDDALVLQTGALTEYIVKLLKSGKRKEDIAYAFHGSIAMSSISVADILREQNGINRVVLSGGVFHNRLLLRMMIEGLKGKGFDIYLPQKVPFNDGCLALGQIAVAKEMLKK
ncbi:MAG: carbamoyltransferase HypF [Spirochaetes bacterium]|nr:carbamoyltransferase HypF [Spirochaetota bacterium]